MQIEAFKRAAFNDARPGAMAGNTDHNTGKKVRAKMTEASTFPRHDVSVCDDDVDSRAGRKGWFFDVMEQRIFCQEVREGTFGRTGRKPVTV